MAVETGLGWIIAVDTADDLEGTPTFVDLPNQQSGGVKFNRSDVPANHKGEAGWETSVSISRGQPSRSNSGSSSAACLLPPFPMDFFSTGHNSGRAEAMACLAARI